MFLGYKFLLGTLHCHFSAIHWAMEFNQHYKDDVILLLVVVVVSYAFNAPYTSVFDK